MARAMQALRRSGCLLAGLGIAAIAPAAPARALQVGIIQQFGRSELERLTLRAPAGETLTASFPQRAEPTPLQARKLELKVRWQRLRLPQIRERVVLGERATFESAERLARQWQQRGVETAITQPDRWQVWAKPQTYGSLLSRRWLLHGLRQQGYEAPSLQTRLIQRVPAVALLTGQGQKRLVGRSPDGGHANPVLVRIASSGDRIRVEPQGADCPARPYPGELKLQRDSYGSYTLVNAVPLAAYLRGVVPYEIGADAPQAALEAQAIIARTYALRNRRRFAADGYQLCADVHCQVYRGLARTNPRIDRAIAATERQVLTHGNELIDALYSATTGGVTAEFDDIWNGRNRPYLEPIVDATQPVWDLEQRPLADKQALRQFLARERGFNESGDSTFRWRRERSLEALADDLRAYLKASYRQGPDFEQLQALEVTERARSGRVLELVARTDAGPIVLTKTEIRSALKPPRSTLFYLEPLYASEAQQRLTGYAFVGGGFGHGVGLSQTGAQTLARQGWSAERILAFYYRQTELRRLGGSVALERRQSAATRQ